MNASPSERKLPAPPVTPENKPYFEAAAKGVLLIGKCSACEAFHFYPRTLCPHCGAEDVQWVPAMGKATVYTYSTLQRGVPVPYTIAYVTLEEGVTMMTNLVDCDPASLAIGQRVRVDFRAAEDGTMVPVFVRD